MKSFLHWSMLVSMALMTAATIWAAFYLLFLLD